jgi:uncharacterized protein (DUF2252 family)
MPANALITALQAHNTGRDPELLAMKYRKMAQDAFLFLRGADHQHRPDPTSAPSAKAGAAA